MVRLSASPQYINNPGCPDCPNRGVVTVRRVAAQLASGWTHELFGKLRGYYQQEASRGPLCWEPLGATAPAKDAETEQILLRLAIAIATADHI